MNENNRLLSTITVLAVLILVFVWTFTTKSQSTQSPKTQSPKTITKVELSSEEKPLPLAAVVMELPVRWGDLGAKLIAAGVIDGEKFEQLYAGRVSDELAAEIKALLYGRDNGQLKITAENSGIILNLLWALGLGAKNENNARIFSGDF